MEQSEYNSVLDLAYAKLAKHSQFVAPKHKNLIHEAQTHLHKAMEIASGVTPEVPEMPKAKGGSAHQQEIAIREIKSVIKGLIPCANECEDDNEAEFLLEAIDALEQIVEEELTDEEKAEAGEIIDPNDVEISEDAVALNVAGNEQPII